MITVTYTQVQKLVKKIPAQKLAIAYRFLTNLTEDKAPSSPGKKSLRGRLRLYANPSLVLREKEAWQDAVREKYGHH